MRHKLFQISLLTKKNFTLQFRRPVGALVELLLPCVFLGLIALVRLSSPVVDHCFSYFDPLSPVKFDNKYPRLSVIGISPDNPQTLAIANCMRDSKDYLQDFVVEQFTEDEIKDIVKELDTTNPAELAKAILKIRTELGIETDNLKLLAIMDKKVLEESLVQNSAMFSAAIEIEIDVHHANYTLGMQTNVARRGRWYTDRDYPYYFRPGPSLFRGYDQGWIALQQVIDRCILEGEGLEKLPVVALRQMPYPAWQEDSFANAIRNSLPLMIVISFLWIGASISKELVGEKASRMKETMKMMGLANWILWLSWIIQRIVLMLVTVFLMTLVMKLANYVLYTHPVILYLFLFEYALTVMCFCFFLSTLFSKTTTAIAGTMLGYFLLYVPYFFLGNEFDNMSDNARYMSCLLSSTCMGYGANIISKWETMEEGLQFSNVATQTSDLDTFTMADVMIMLFVDIIIYSLMTWYVEAVFPGEFGIKQKPWFMFTKTYWMGSEINMDKDGDGMPPVDGDGIPVPPTVIDVEDAQHEKRPRHKTVGISIQGLVKRFETPKGKMTAVDGLSLDMYQGQITSLLGHNGAGKTTTMSMLTGLFSPSGGNALVNGHSILTSMDKVRGSLGMCPQHNVLFDRLTVKEHLLFFIRLKGYDGDIMTEAYRMMEMLKLEDKVDTKADELSGGMKRKLSVGVALAGGSKVVILDEPTAGMDPYARRATWDLILENKEGRTILLTTHYMDEADFLGDRVAIMASGKLVCSGSSMFLKKKYGVGYHLTLVKKPGCDVPAVEEFIKKHVASAQKISDVGSELVFILPDNQVDNFVPLFKKLEEDNLDDKADIESFGLSLTTMEEVFMKVGEEEEDKKNLLLENGKLENGDAIKIEKQDEDLAGNVRQFKVFKPEELNFGLTLLVQQLEAMIRKRFINSMRYKKAIIAQLILPLLFAVLGLLVVYTAPSPDAEESRFITLTDYPGKGMRGMAFLADLTDTGDTDNYFSTPITDYLETQNLFGNSLGEAVRQNKTDYQNKAEYLKETCCLEQSLELAEVCVDLGLDKLEWKFCADKRKSVWGYKACYDTCFEPTAAPNATCGDRPEVHEKYLDDDLSYFNNVFLGQIEGDVKFYRKKQVAYTRSYVSKEVVRLLKSTDGKALDDYDESSADFVLGTTNLDAEKQIVLTGWFSHEGIHLAPGVQNAMSNMQLVSGGKSKRINVMNRPLPKSLIDRFMDAGASLQAGSLSIMMLLGFSFLTTSFVLFVVEERENKSKHLQQISGVNGIVYWAGTFMWDMLNYTVCILIVTIVFLIFNLEGLRGQAIGAVFVHLLIYGYASIPFVYLCSLPFNSPVSAYAIIAVFTFISGLAGYIANLILTIQNDDFQPTLQKILLILPNFCFIQGLTDIYGNGIQRFVYDTCVGAFGEIQCKKQGFTTSSVFAVDGPNLSIGEELLAMFAVGTAAMIIVLSNEMLGKTISLMGKTGVKSPIPHGEDDDVKAERTRVSCEVQKLTKESAVVMTNLRKCYGDTIAVQNLTLGIPKNQCFGLLGVNGAGKTTTFSMLTGDVPLTGGEAFIAGYDLKKDIRKIQQRIGYCPQFDALIGVMTGRELLSMFANCRGIPRQEIEQTVNEAIKNLNLDEYADKLCGSYSGGNKRKLSTAIALVGNPEVLFLDEPTAGMDPNARRFLWTVLADLIAANIGTSIVLTTHSMEECEALCNRLVIMVNGAFRCLGGIQHLKGKYGDGYTLTMTMSEEKQENCILFMKKIFPDAILKEEHMGYLHYELSAGIAWSTIFDEMEKNRKPLYITDYAVNQTSLEQVFLNFAKDQRSEDETVVKRGCCSCCYGGKKESQVEDSSAEGRRLSRVSMNRRASIASNAKVRV
ncbi:phospholipid-transporting ATPase ABCA3-like isoform X4 [Bolinopsis microptera]|uniref:phospholipid-transporting ATPase ABCA3-like isoform X4 n=1 Tax=Bolinopsis microptera TaxID=2820187 RepID=UPI0030793463